MDLGLAGAGAGAAEGLQKLIMQQLLERQLAQHDQEFQLKQQELAQRDREMSDARREAQQTRQQALNLRQLQALAPGTELSPDTFSRLTNVDTGAAVPEQFQKIQGTPASLPSTSMAGFVPLGGGGQTNISQTLSQAIPDKYRFGGTAEQLATQRTAEEKQRESDARIAEATRRLNDAEDRARTAETLGTERLRLAGENTDLRSQFGTANLEMKRLQLELQKERDARQALEKGGKPEMYQDPQGNWHALSFDPLTRKYNEVPLPAGFVPTSKQAAPGWFSRTFGNMFGGSSQPETPQYLSTDPNAGGHP